MDECFAYMYTRVFSACEGQKALEPLEPELEMALSHMEAPCEFQELNLGSLQKQTVLLKLPNHLSSP